MYATIKRVMLGRPFPTRDDIHERLDNLRALAIFASDPISSNAYATEAIMTVLLILGAAALQWTLPLALSVAALVLIVVTSYIQTIRHYPDGGGAYIVTKDNLGETPSLFAAAALLIDYVLTVSVSVSAGMRALTSAFPALEPYIIVMAVTSILLLAWINLRGIRESGSVFALPTYAFIGGVVLVLLVGVGQSLTGTLQTNSVAAGPIAPVSNLLLIWVLVRAFAAGCTALTGIEAISNGVQAFKRPEANNAIKTMVAMGVVAMLLFVGISYLASKIHLIPSENETILSQLTRTVVGDGVLYYWVQTFTMLILVLAANTGFQDFPRLSSYLARDGFMPRWMQHRGERLVYDVGIVTLAIFSIFIVLLFHADEIAMLPLYALGVMLSFSLSQLSMGRLMGRIAHLKPGERLRTSVTEVHYETGIAWKRVMNFVGATATTIVLVALTVTKFVEGAWIVVIALGVLVVLFRFIKKHYIHVADALRVTNHTTFNLVRPIAKTAVVPLADLHQGTLRALHFAKRFAPRVVAVIVVTDEAAEQLLREKWVRFSEVTADIVLKIIPYDYRDILSPLVAEIEQIKRVEYPNEELLIVIPEFVSDSWFGGLLHNQTARMLQNRLRHQEGIVLVDVPYQIHDRA